MKKISLILAAVAAMFICLVLTPSTQAEAAKKKMPKNGETFKSATFTENEALKGKKGTCHWIVTKIDGVKKYYPVFETKSMVYYAPNMYVQVGKKLYYTDKDGAISWGKNPQGYKVSKYGYCIIPKEEDTKQEDTKKDTKDTSTTKKSGTRVSKAAVPSGYTIKSVSGVYRCIDKDGSWVTGFVGPYYFDSSYGMALGLTYIGGSYYYFSTDLETMGKMVTGMLNTSGNSWMYFDDTTGKALVDQQITIDGKKYYLNSSGYMTTGWVGNDYYSNELDRYGQLVYSR